MGEFLPFASGVVRGSYWPIDDIDLSNADDELGSMDRRKLIVAVGAVFGGSLWASGGVMAQPSDAWRGRAIRLPAEFSRYHEIGGELIFTAYSDADGDENSALAAIGSVIADAKLGKLRSLGSRPITERTFYGDWYDPQTGDLVRLGTTKTEDGRSLINPRLRDLEGVARSGGAYRLPEAGSGGQFAYAFSWTPYGLRARPLEVQRLFDSISGFILPPGSAHEILDWSGPQLVGVSEYFRAGMEWWGVFLFTIYTPSNRRLVVIAGSTTD